MFDGNPMFLGPFLQRFNDVFWSVVHPTGAWLTAPFDDPIKAPDHTLSRQGKVDLYARLFTVEVVQDIQQPKCTTIIQPGGNEIHGPGHIGRLRHHHRVGLVSFQSLAGLDPKVHFELAIGAINPFVVSWMPLDVA